MSVDEAYESLLQDIVQLASLAPYSLNHAADKDQKRIHSRALAFTAPLAHFSYKRLVRDIRAATELNVDVETDGSVILVVVPHPRDVKWRCCERYTKAQITVFVLTAVIAPTIMCAGAWIMYHVMQ